MPRPPRATFVGNIKSDIAGNNFERSLQNLSQSLFKNRVLNQRQENADRSFDEQVRQFDKTDDTARAAVDLKANQNKGLRNLIETFKPGTLDPDQVYPTAALNSLASSMQKTSSEKTAAATQLTSANSVMELFEENLNVARSGAIVGRDGQFDAPGSSETATPRKLSAREERDILIKTMREAETLNDFDPTMIDNPIVKTRLDTLNRRVVAEAKSGTSKDNFQRLTRQRLVANGVIPENATPDEIETAEREVSELMAQRVGQAETKRGLADIGTNDEKLLSVAMQAKAVNLDGTPVSTPLTVGDLKSGKFRILSTKDQEFLKAHVGLVATFDELRRISEAVFTAEDFGPRIMQSVKLFFADKLDVNLVGTDAEATQLKAIVGQFKTLRAVIPTRIVRALGEVGTLTDGDIERAQTIFAKLYGDVGVSPSRSTVLKGINSFQDFLVSVKNRTVVDLNKLLSNGEKRIRVVGDLKPKDRGLSTGLKNTIDTIGAPPKG